MMKILFLLPLLLASPLAAAATFSIYLTAPAGPAPEGAMLEVREDLHIDVNGTVIPLRLKEARQSIEYPCATGARMDFFRMATESSEREVLGSVTVPTEAGKGLIVLAPRDGKLAVTPMWWTAAELKKGSGLFVNLSGRALGLSCAGQRIGLLAGKRWAVSGKFGPGVELAPIRVEIFDRRDGTEFSRILDQSVAIPKDDTGIFLIVPKLGSYVSLVVLEAGGTRDPIARDALAKGLAPAAASGQPVVTPDSDTP